MDTALCSRTVTSWQERTNICESSGWGPVRTKSPCLPRAVMDEHVRHPVGLLRQLRRGCACPVRVVQLLLHHQWQVLSRRSRLQSRLYFSIGQSKCFLQCCFCSHGSVTKAMDFQTGNILCSSPTVACVMHCWHQERPQLLLCFIQGSHASWKVLESHGFFFLKIPGPGKSWKITLVLESAGN